MIEQKIVLYSNEMLRPFISLVHRSYEESMKINIPYTVWMERYLKAVYSDSDRFKVKKISGQKHVRYITSTTMYRQYKTIEQEIIRLKSISDAEHTRVEEINSKIFELQKNTFKPDLEFDYPGVEYINELPVWFADSSKQLSLFIGAENADLSKPYSFQIGDSNVHTNVQGTTGAGKSVFMHNVIMNLLLLYPPWELDLQLIDNKMAEFHLYGRTVETPHCNVVAATNAKEFIIDLYESFSEENQRRQELFNAVGVNKLADLRKKFDLVMPRRMFIVDELVAMLTAIEDTANAGNDNVSGEKKAIFSVLQKVATLGRNAGVHMLISSQDLGEKLDIAVAKQLQSGIALKGDSSISKSCIGNDKGQYIDRVGIAIANPTRQMGDNEKNNVEIGIPFLQTEVKPGEISKPQQLLTEMVGISDKYRFKKDFLFYDAAALIPYSEYELEMKTIKQEIERDKEIWQCIIPVGKNISYRNTDIVTCHTSYKQGDGFIIDCKEDKLMRYLFKLIKNSVVNEYNTGEVAVKVYSTGKEMILRYDLKREYDYEIISKFPEKELRVFNTRSKILDFDTYMCDSESTDLVKMFKRVYSLWGLKSSVPELRILEKAFSGGVSSVEELQGNEKNDLANAEKFIRLYLNTKDTAKILTSKGNLFGGSFQQRLVFWNDLQNLDDLISSEVKSSMKTFFTKSASVGFINVVSCSNWSNDRFSSLLDGCCRNVIECSTKELYRSLSLGGYVANVNSDSLLLHDRNKKGEEKFIKIFGGIL